jgi:hypothetical protein
LCTEAMSRRGTFFPSLNGFEEVQGPDAEIFRDYVPDIVCLSRFESAIVCC